MERVRKMILVPEGSMSPGPAGPTTSTGPVEEKSLQTPGDNFSRLDTEMYNVLRAKGARDDYEKCLNYLQILRRYLFFRDSERIAERETNHEIDEIEETLAPLSDEDILQGILKVHTRKARLLLRHWRTAVPERLKWDNAGTVSIDGRQIPHSVITEKNNAEAEVPAGRFKFAKFLITSETPVNLIENPKVLKIGNILTALANTAKRRLPQRGAILASTVEGENIGHADAPSPILTLSKKQAKKKWMHFNM